MLQHQECANYLKNLATFSNPYSLSISFSFLVLKPQPNSLKQNNEETKNT